MHRQVKLERLQKVQIWAFDLFDKRFLNWNKIIKKQSSYC